MEISQLLLIAHMGGAAATAFLICSGIVSMLRNRSHIYTKAASRIAIAACYELITGSLLALSSPATSPFRFCTNIAIYLAIVSGVEGVLYTRIVREKALIFPLRGVIASLGTGLAFVIFAVAGM